MISDRGFVLGVDLDGVCGDYTAAFANVVAAERDVDASTLPAQRGWDFAECHERNVEALRSL